MKGRSGRKSKAEEMGLQALLDECWTVGARKRCIKSLATLAEAGDMDATRLLLSYAYGKPRESVDLNADSEIILKVVYGAGNQTT